MAGPALEKHDEEGSKEELEGRLLVKVQDHIELLLRLAWPSAGPCTSGLAVGRILPMLPDSGLWYDGRPWCMLMVQSV